MANASMQLLHEVSPGARSSRANKSPSTLNMTLYGTGPCSRPPLDHDADRRSSCRLRSGYGPGPLGMFPPAGYDGVTSCLAILRFRTTAAADSPNIVLIYADDLGYGDVSGATRFRTPRNFDRLAREGLRVSPTRTLPCDGELQQGRGRERRRGWGLRPRIPPRN